MKRQSMKQELGRPATCENVFETKDEAENKVFMMSISINYMKWLLFKDTAEDRLFVDLGAHGIMPLSHKFQMNTIWRSKD